MVFKLLESVAAACSATYKSHKLLRKSRSSGWLLTKRKFCSNDDPDDSPKEPKIEDLLKSSSPLRSASIDEFWATSPYPEGTVFRELEEEDPEKKNNNDLSTKSVILFPGQGNQFVGMAKNLLKYQVAVDMFKIANDILGYDLLKICLEGPENVLNDTKYCQPATFVCSLALLEKLKEERPWAISNCIATCGYSLGELTALVFAGCLNYEKGLNLVKVRAEAMAECCKTTSGGMLTVFTGPRTTLSEAMSAAVEHCKSIGIEEPRCNVASYLFPNCKVVAGNTEALEFLKTNATNYGIRRHSMLPVSGAFHTLLMKDAEEPFKKKLRNINLSTPIIKVFSNITAKPYKSVEHILKTLPKQISRPVKWEQTMQNILMRRNSPLPYLYECGPGNSLITVAGKVNNLATSTSYAVRL